MSEWREPQWAQFWFQWCPAAAIGLFLAWFLARGARG